MDTIRRHPIGAFLVAAYAISALVFAVPVLSQNGLGIVPVELPGAAPFILIVVIAMIAVTFAVTAIADGREGVRDLRRRAFRFLVSPVWYLAALVLLPLAALGVAVATEGTEVLTAIADNPAIAVTWLMEIVVAFLLVNLWEELAWAGFVLHRLQPRVGPLRATALTTFAHAALHLPLLVVVGGVSDVRIPPESYPFYLAALFLFPLGNRTVATWLYNRSGNSVPIAGLTHAAWNLATGSLFIPALVPGAQAVWSYAAFAIVAVVVIVATRGRLGFPTDASPATAVRGLSASAATH